MENTSLTFGGLKGYSAGKTISILKAPLLYGGLSWKGELTNSLTITFNSEFQHWQFCIKTTTNQQVTTNEIKTLFRKKNKTDLAQV